jgi:putative heme-binding domain-containing protein
LWAAYGCGAFDRDLALTMLDHPSEHVRSWTVRLLGDARQMDPSVAVKVVALAHKDPSIVVRAQLAATAKRLPGAPCLAIVKALVDRDEDGDDPQIPWLLWWALEDKAIAERQIVLGMLADRDAWKNRLKRENLIRLMRRYAATGTADGYSACCRIRENTAEERRESVLQALYQGLTERSRGLTGVATGGLFDGVAAASTQPDATAPVRFEPPTAELRAVIMSAWQSQRDHTLPTRLALEAGLDEAYRYLIGQLQPGEPVDRLLQWLAILIDYARDDCIPAVLALAADGQKEAVRMAAIGVLQRFSNDTITAAILGSYPRMSDSLKSRARDLFFSRPQSSLAFLKLVEDRRVDPASVPLDQLRRLSLFQNDEIDAVVRRHWGNIQPGTPEEKLADMRRFNNDLRAGTGDSGRGHELFKKHCGTCHKLQGEGTTLGPDLTNTVKGDQDSLLASIVDPSAVVRRDFLSFVVVTKSGVVHSGLMAEQNAASVTLLDAKNHSTRINRDDIDEINESPTSLMPERLLEQLSPQELRDLFAYLRK